MAGGGPAAGGGGGTGGPGERGAGSPATHSALEDCKEAHRKFSS